MAGHGGIYHGLDSGGHIASAEAMKVHVGMRVRWEHESPQDWWLGTVDYVYGPEIGIKWDNGHKGTGWDLHKPPYELFTEDGRMIQYDDFPKAEAPSWYDMYDDGA